MTVVLHIGTHKTGTTSVQTFARNHRVALRERGLWYPGFEEVGRNPRTAHFPLAEAYAVPERSSLTGDQADAFIDHLRRSSRANETILLSAESFYGHLCDLRKEQRRAFVERVRRAFRDDDVRIVMVCRRQSDFADSLYQERVKASRYPFDFRKFLKRDRHWFEYCRHANAFREFFEDVEVWRFDDLVSHGVIRSFFARLGVDVADLDQNQPAMNRSLPLELIEFKLLINLTAIGDFELDRLRKRLDELSNAEQRAPGLREAWIPSLEQEEFASSFDAENERLRQIFAPDIPPPFFPVAEQGHAPAARPIYKPMTARRFAELAVELLPLHGADRFRGRA